jgi:hypothetical protein
MREGEVLKGKVKKKKGKEGRREKMCLFEHNKQAVFVVSNEI